MNYAVHEKEMLILVDALEERRHYLLGSEIHIFTDNSALRCLQNSARPSSRQIRWVEKLQVYSPLKIAHFPGKTNTAADALSRSPTLQEEVTEVGRPPQLDLSFLGDLAVAATSTFSFQPSGLAPLVTEQLAEWWQDYLSDTNIRKYSFNPDTELLKNHTIRHNGLL